MSNISQKHNLTTSSTGGKPKTKKRRLTPRKKVSKKKRTLKKNKKRSKKPRGGANDSIESPILSNDDDPHSMTVYDDASSFDDFFPDFPYITESQVQALEDSLYELEGSLADDSWASSMNYDIMNDNSMSRDSMSVNTTHEDISRSFDNPLNTAFTEEGGKKKRRK